MSKPNDPISLTDACMDDITKLTKIPARSIFQYWFATAMNTETDYCINCLKEIEASAYAELELGKIKSLKVRLALEAKAELCSELSLYLEGRKYDTSNPIKGRGDAGS